MSSITLRILAFDAALAASRKHALAGDLPTAFDLLKSAHVLGQRDFWRHLQVHGRMLAMAWAMRDPREVRGQLLRLLLTPLGHLSGRLPVGNTGASDVSAFAPMPVPAELQRLLGDPEK